jgi:hypothetical protein
LVNGVDRYLGVNQYQSSIDFLLLFWCDPQKAAAILHPDIPRRKRQVRNPQEITELEAQIALDKQRYHEIEFLEAELMEKYLSTTI